ncbi:MAG: nicotinate phosphoribosyltransferase [Kistimonas sp.]|nr:nicotinate phosphoribosyltransferase [Kistimonas sp.]
MSDPVVASLLDTDSYKFSMQQAIHQHYPDVEVVFSFICRSPVDLTHLAGAVREQVTALGDLRLTADERRWLGEVGILRPDYLDWLERLRLDPSRVQVRVSGGQLCIDVRGIWAEVTLFEIYILTIVNELYARQRPVEKTLAQARVRLTDKLNWLEAEGLKTPPLSVVDFGTRRRLSGAWQQELLQTFHARLPEVLQGTSNVMLARTLALPVRGTMGHEWIQAHQGLTQELGSSQRRALQLWLEEYPHQPGVALTDTIGMTAFLRDFDVSLAGRYKGMRHDSGDPLTWGERALRHYEELGVAVQDKTLMFSDNLDFGKAVQIHRHFAGRIATSFGIGTWLTNDAGGAPLNAVVKLLFCNGRPVAKISDEPGKTLSPDPKHLARVRKAYSCVS